MRRLAIVVLLIGCAPLIEHEQACAEFELLYQLKRSNGELEADCILPRCPWVTDVAEPQLDMCLAELEPIQGCYAFHEHAINECP